MNGNTDILTKHPRVLLLQWVVLVVVVMLACPVAHAQRGPFLPWPFTTPVMDVLRREAAASYADMRERELDQKVLERIYDEMAGLGIDGYHWRSIAGTLNDIERVLASGASLGYQAGDLLDRIDDLFRITGGYDPASDQAARWEAILETYRTMAGTGMYVADDLEVASVTVGAIKEQIEQIGQGFNGFTELGSHQESAQSELQAAIMAAEDMVQMRQSIAMQTNADVVAFMEQIAQDRLLNMLIRCHITGAGCSLDEGETTEIVFRTSR